MNRMTTLVAAAAFGLAAALFVGGPTAGAAAPAPTAPASGPTDLNSDTQAGQAGEQATANDKDTAAEFNSDTGSADNVGEQGNNTGDQGGSAGGQSGDQGAAGDTGAGGAAGDTGASGASGATGDTGSNG